ncbi:Arginase/deacetylase [Acaromyces ingoldii]|uniref:Arginase/deacetylase n=1 Tax=Acaromyces ingoldii TaxID=215250 RepID=A0A316YPB5_9BASI|nr:Arginase/deacetylase [Acaromyces ingoldii]PWN91071.1 Arginase/deacetylase [Acaromyces ingoldii]
MRIRTTPTFVSAAPEAFACVGSVPFPLQAAEPLLIPGDGEPTADSIFSGVTTFAHLPFGACFSPLTGSIPDTDLVKPGNTFDIAFVGTPFDTGTSFRPGARFGPNGIRQGSRRLTLYGGYNVALDVNPFKDWARIVDCGDVPVTPYDNNMAIEQMTKGHKKLLHTAAKATTIKGPSGKTHTKPLYTKTGKVHPRIITLGGDHTIVLPILRSINSAYGPVSVIHFDSHLDTWQPSVFGAGRSKTASINHGTYFWHAAREGLIRNGSSVHAGIRTTLSGPSDYRVDKEAGFQLNEARLIDQIGTQGIIDNIRKAVEGNPVYLSIDIDVLDPSAAPATGTPETGGWSSRELRTIIRGLEGLDIVGADLVEVSPPYDNQAEVTQQVAADVLYEVMSLMVKRGPLIDVSD